MDDNFDDLLESIVTLRPRLKKQGSSQQVSSSTTNVMGGKDERKGIIIKKVKLKTEDNEMDKKPQTENMFRMLADMMEKIKVSINEKIETSEKIVMEKVKENSRKMEVGLDSLRISVSRMEEELESLVFSLVKEINIDGRSNEEEESKQIEETDKRGSEEEKTTTTAMINLMEEKAEEEIAEEGKIKECETDEVGRDSELQDDSKGSRETKEDSVKREIKTKDLKRKRRSLASWQRPRAPFLPLEGWESKVVEVEGQEEDRPTVLSIILVCNKISFYGEELGGKKRRGGAMWLWVWGWLGKVAARAGRVRWSAHSSCGNQVSRRRAV